MLAMLSGLEYKYRGRAWVETHLSGHSKESDFGHLASLELKGAQKQQKVTKSFVSSILYFHLLIMKWTIKKLLDEKLFL